MEKKENTHRTALLIMDIQNAITSHLPDAQPLLKNIEKAANAARHAGIQVIFVQLAFREGHPEIHDEHPRFKALKQSKTMFTHAHESSAIHPDITISPNDIIVVKKRVSAFTGSDLDLILRANKIEFLVLSGISTTGVVLGTLREAADKDYKVTVLSDACADPDPEVHEMLIKKVIPFSGETATVDEWIQAI